MPDRPRVLDGGLLLARHPERQPRRRHHPPLGSLIVAHTWTAATARARLPQDQRRDAALVIDECHNFLNLPYRIDDLLAEARGLRLSLTLAHQNLAQLPAELRAGITTNARNKIIFTVGADDARDLARHTQPHLDDYDLAHLDAFHAAARLLDHAALTPAFTLRTRPLPPPARAARASRAAAARHARQPPPPTQETATQDAIATDPRPQRPRIAQPARPCRRGHPPRPQIATPPHTSRPASPLAPGSPTATSPRSPPGSPPATSGCSRCCTNTAS